METLLDEVRMLMIRITFEAEKDPIRQIHGDSAARSGVRLGQVHSANYCVLYYFGEYHSRLGLEKEIKHKFPFQA
jgi:hypothetical protein